MYDLVSACKPTRVEMNASATLDIESNEFWLESHGFFCRNSSIMMLGVTGARIMMEQNKLSLAAFCLTTCNSMAANSPMSSYL